VELGIAPSSVNRKVSGSVMGASASRDGVLAWGWPGRLGLVVDPADDHFKLARGHTATLGVCIGAPALSAAAAVNALDPQADIATTRIYDHRSTRSEDRPTFKVAY
jgi:hypothetical protein